MSETDRAAAVLTVDLGAVAANWRRCAAQAPGAETGAVVKADSYGLGAAKVAPALFRAGCRTFFVATVEEGIHLRQALPEGRIFVLGGPLPGTEAEFPAHGLTPILNSPEQIALWSSFARRRGEALEAGLHLDTGMSRLGLDRPAVERLADDRSLLDGIRPVVVMSHMACADEPAREMNTAQLEAFRALAGRLALPCPLSLAASSAIFLGPDWQFGLTRPGAALYGLNPVPDQPNPMAPVIRLRGRILQVRDVDSPMTVGYGATHRITRKGRLAIVSVGYADGYFRTLSNRGHAVIEGERVPVVGRVSMDLTIFDVTGVDAARPGAMIDLIGPGHDADALAAEAGTIGYEVLTALGNRIQRHYVGEA